METVYHFNAATYWHFTFGIFCIIVAIFRYPYIRIFLSTSGYKYFYFKSDPVT